MHDIRVGDIFIKPSDWEAVITKINDYNIQYNYRFLYEHNDSGKWFTNGSSNIDFFLNRIGYRVNSDRIVCKLDDSLFEVE